MYRQLICCCLFLLDRSSAVQFIEEREDDETDCAFRRLFFDNAKKNVPWRKDMTDVFDALKLANCQKTISTPSTTDSKTGTETVTSHHRQARTRYIDDAAAYTFHVCPRKGRDSFSGNYTHPFSSLERALQATRAYSATHYHGSKNTTAHTPLPKRTIVFHEGIHYLKSTVVLTHLDSNLVLRSASNETTAWLSGGKLIESRDTSWKKMNENSPIWLADLSALDIPAITGLFTLDPHERMTLARFPNADVEEWDAPNRYIPHDDVKEWSFPPFSEVPKFVSIDLTLPDNPTGHIKNDSAMADYNSYGTGQGGACASVWGDQPSYWCSDLAAGGWADVDKAAALAGRMNIPRGMVLAKPDSDIFQKARHWKNPSGGVVHVAHTQGWAWHMFNISNLNPGPDSITVNFDTGGSQGGRNWQCKDGNGHLSDCDGDDKKLEGGDWYVEGIFEELDSPGEFFYDTDKKLLYFYPKESSCNGKQLFDVTNSTLRKHRRSNRHYISRTCIPDLVASNLQTMFKIQGSMRLPVRNIHFHHVGFRDAAKTIMEQWEAPSGGDWALHRGGAIHLEGTENISVTDSKFHRIDGNAIMLGGYCHGTRVARSDFAWIGNGAMATFGDTEEYDATKPTQPRYSLIEENVINNIGLYQKQSSGWGQNKACLNTIRNNVMFNLPRAAINFNDGLGGGNLVKGNVIFNACRESGDHGPINSWDRMPFLTSTSGEPSFKPLPTQTTRNFILANYGASEGFDNDDGSSFYHTYENVFYSSDGFKMDYGGHDSKFFNNLVYAINKHCFGTGSFIKGHRDFFFNNTCIVIDTRHPSSESTNVGTLWECSLDGMNPTNNHYFTESGKATWGCLPDKDISFEEMQHRGFEKGSSVDMIPGFETVIVWAKQILGV